jgi:hypothetical protein
VAGNEAISCRDGGTRGDREEVSKSELEDRERVPGVGVLRISDGFGETSAEGRSRRRDRGNSVNSALAMIRSAKSRSGLQRQGEGEHKRNRSPEMQAEIANPERAHGLKVTGGGKQKGPPNRVVLFYSDEGVLEFAILILEDKSIRFANAVEHGVDRDCDSPIAQRGFVCRSSLEPAPHFRRGVRTRTSRLFVRGGIRTINVHAASTGSMSLATIIYGTPKQ